MKKRNIAVFLLIISVFFSFSCRKKPQVKGIEFTVDFSDKALSDSLITNVEYKWKTTTEFKKMSEDYSVFVHFWHKNNMLFQDDYVPDVPTSKWEPNKEYSFKHRIYIPPFIDELDPQFEGDETLKLSVGLVSPFDRTGKSNIQIFEKKLKVTPPPPDTPGIIYETGWYPQEIDPKAFLKQWKWTGKEARCLIDNPMRDALLVVKGGLNMDALKDQKVIIKINDMVLDEFVPTGESFDKSYDIKKDMLGAENEFRLTIATDKTFIPAQALPGSADPRELGIQVSFLYFR
jgi:hypothetical protein